MRVEPGDKLMFWGVLVAADVLTCARLVRGDLQQSRGM